MDNHLGLAEVRRAHQKDKEMTEQEVAILSAKRHEVKLSAGAMDSLRSVLEGYLSLRDYPLELSDEARLVRTYRLLVRIRQRLSAVRSSYTLGLSSDEVEVLRPILESACGEASLGRVGLYETTVASTIMQELHI